MSYSFPRAQPEPDAATQMRRYILSLVPLHMELADVPENGACQLRINHDNGKVAFNVTIPSNWAYQVRSYFDKDTPPSNKQIVNFLLDRVEELMLYRARAATGEDWFVFDADQHVNPRLDA